MLLICESFGDYQHALPAALVCWMAAVNRVFYWRRSRRERSLDDEIWRTPIYLIYKSQPSIKMYIHYSTCTMEDSILQISSLLDFTPSTSVLETIEDTSFLNVISPTKRHHSSTPLKPDKRLKLDSTVSSDDSMNDSFNFNLNDTDNTTITYFDEEEQEEHSRAPNLPVRYAVSPENVSTYSAVHQDSADLFSSRTAIPQTSDTATDFSPPCTIFTSVHPTSSARATGETGRTSVSPGEYLITTTYASTATATLISTLLKMRRKFCPFTKKNRIFVLKMGIFYPNLLNFENKIPIFLGNGQNFLRIFTSVRHIKVLIYFKIALHTTEGEKRDC